MTSLPETRRTDWIAYGHYGYAAYRIWVRRTVHGNFQRHEWKREDGSIRMDDWIPTPFGLTTGSLVEEAA